MRADYTTNPSARPWQRAAIAWAFLWAVSMLAASSVLRLEWVSGAAARWAVAIAPCLVAVLMVRAYLGLLRELDELTRRLNLEAMAIGFAAGIIAAMGYPVLERAGAPHLDDIVTLAMSGGAMLGVVVGRRRYR